MPDFCNGKVRWLAAALRGWIHPDLMLGFEVIGSHHFDGLGSRDLIRVTEIHEQGSIALIAIADLIADRRGNFLEFTVVVENSRVELFACAPAGPRPGGGLANQSPLHPNSMADPP